LTVQADAGSQAAAADVIRWGWRLLDVRVRSANGSIGRLLGLKVENQLNAFWTVKILAAKNPE
jgi:hypothetical protein